MSFPPVNPKKILCWGAIITILTASTLAYLGRAKPYTGSIHSPKVEKSIVQFDGERYLLIILGKGEWANRMVGTINTMEESELNLSLMWRSNMWPSLAIGPNRTHFSDDWGSLISIKINSDIDKITYGNNRQVLWTRKNGLSSKR